VKALNFTQSVCVGKSHFWVGKKISKLLLVALLLTNIVTFGIEASAASSTKPTVSGFKVFPSTVSTSGGSVLLTARVTNATRCIITVKPVVSGVSYNKPCSSGNISYRLSLPGNTTNSNIAYSFRLLVTGRTGQGNVVAPIQTATVVAPPKPIINSFVSSQSTLPSSGGTINLTAVVSNETSCSLSVSPSALESLGTVACSSGSISANNIGLAANNSVSNISYVFTLSVTGNDGTTTKNLTVTVDSANSGSGGSAGGGSSTTTTTTPPSTTVGNTIGVPAQPDALVQVGNDIWVASCSGNSVTEIDKNTKQVIQVLTSSSDNGFNCPDALAFDGNNIWVANRLGNSITELTSNGTPIRILGSSEILNPVSIAVNGANLWVLNYGANVGKNSFLTEINISTGTIVSTVIPPPHFVPWGLSDPTSIAFAGSVMWLTDGTGQNAIELRVSNGSYVREAGTGAAYSATLPSDILYKGGAIWVTGSGNNSVVEFNASSGAYIRHIVVKSPQKVIAYGNNLIVSTVLPDSVLEYSPSGTLVKAIYRSSVSQGIGDILYDGTHIWIANYKSSSITELTS
jgi:hypothetical protein